MTNVWAIRVYPRYSFAQTFSPNAPQDNVVQATPPARKYVKSCAGLTFGYARGAVGSGLARGGLGLLVGQSVHRVSGFFRLWRVFLFGLLTVGSRATAGAAVKNV